MSFWDNFKVALSKWFLSSNAQKSGVELTQVPTGPAAPTAPPAAPPPAVPPPPTAGPPALAPASTISTAESVIKLLGAGVSLIKGLGALGSLGKGGAAGSDDSGDAGAFGEGASDVINDSSQVVD